MAADLIKKVLAFPLSSLNFKGLSFYFEGLTYVYMLLTFSFQCHFRFILINILVGQCFLAFQSKQTVVIDIWRLSINNLLDMMLNS